MQNVKLVNLDYFHYQEVESVLIEKAVLQKIVDDFLGFVVVVAAVDDDVDCDCYDDGLSKRTKIELKPKQKWLIMILH